MAKKNSTAKKRAVKPRTIIRTVLFLVLAACLVGTAYVLRPGWFDWSEEHFEPIRDPTRSASSGPKYGRAVAINGDFAAIGIPFFCGHNVIDGGAVDIRRRDGDQWKSYASLRASDDRPGLSFGIGLDMCDQFIAVAAWGFAEDDLESIYVFRREGNPDAPQWVEEAVLRPSVPVLEGDSNNVFPIAIDGNTLVVGAEGFWIDDGVPEDFLTGSAFVFERDDQGVWSETAILKPDILERKNYFGQSVDIQGDTIAIGAPGRNEVFVYQRTPSGWKLTETLATTVPEAERHFGISVDIEGDRIAVGSGWDDWNREGDGDVHIFRRDTTSSVWALEHVLTSDEPLLGEVVAINNSLLAARARRFDPSVPQADFQAISQPSLVLLFDLETGEWIDNIELVFDTASEHPLFGAAIAISDDWLLTGAPRVQTGKYPAIGAVQFLRISDLEDPWLLEYMGPIEDGIYTNRGFKYDHIDHDILMKYIREQPQREREERRKARENK